jgi:alpha-ketoglutarate-dependent taurine dioxygenase
MAGFTTRNLSDAFGVEITDLSLSGPLAPEDRQALLDLFDDRGLLVFPDVDIDHATQAAISMMLIRREHELLDTGEGRQQITDTWYISNKREKAAAPFGRLQFHADGMWADEPFEMVSLYGAEVDEPSVPTIFVSNVVGAATLPDELRARIEGLHAVHTAGEVRRGDLTDVLVTTVEDAPSTVKPLLYTHPRTGDQLLYICEQMTDRIEELDREESERLLQELFDHLYRDDARVEHVWRKGDFVVWDNIAVQHGRGKVDADGPARTLRKVAHPVPQLSKSQLPAFSVVD